MFRKNIKFDEIIKHRINRDYVIKLFTNKQNTKKKNLHRLALQNQTIKNIHHIYDRDIQYFREKGDIFQYYSTSTDTTSEIYFDDNYNSEFYTKENIFNDELCFITED